MAWYRLVVDWTYSKPVDANAAESAINAELASRGRAEVVTRPSNTQVSLTIDNLSEQDAIALGDALLAGWNRGTREAGKAAITRRDEA